MPETLGKIIIEQILADLKIKAPTLAKNIGVSYSKIYDIQRGKTEKISGDIANAIVTAYPQYNVLWLFTGEGNMLKSTKDDNNNISDEGFKTHGVDKTHLITMPQSVWDVIERQSKSLSRKDDQIDKLIEIIENQKGVAEDATNVAPKEAHG